jgi:hypothetical protein
MLNTNKPTKPILMVGWFGWFMVLNATFNNYQNGPLF